MVSLFKEFCGDDGWREIVVAKGAEVMSQEMTCVSYRALIP
jgi:hypothetical protein